MWLQTSHDFFVFESSQTAEDVMVLPCDFTAVCHDSKTNKSTQQRFFNFQENLNEGKWIPSTSWRRSSSLIWCIGTFLSALKTGLFSAVFSIKTSHAARKNSKCSQSNPLPHQLFQRREELSWVKRQIEIPILKSSNENAKYNIIYLKHLQGSLLNVALSDLGRFPINCDRFLFICLHLTSVFDTIMRCEKKHFPSKQCHFARSILSTSVATSNGSCGGGVSGIFFSTSR
jgi:hypothetical protein